MSIEKTIEDLTTAVNLLSHTIQKLVTVGAVQASGTAKSPEAAFKAAEAQAAVSDKGKAAKAPKAEKAKADKTDKELMDEVLEEDAAASNDGLPAGERDEEYYKKHVRPHIIALGDKDRPAAIAVLESFGVKKAPDLDPAKWGALVDAVKAALAGPAAADEDDLG